MHLPKIGIPGAHQHTHTHSSERYLGRSFSFRKKAAAHTRREIYSHIVMKAFYGALTTLQYNLTAAPASQPRHAFFAQIFASTTSLCLGYIPTLPTWFRSAHIYCMAKLGIIHPPAGAAAIVFSTGTLGWVFLSGVFMTIVTAVIINNMSDRRQYPMSWILVNKAKNSCGRKE